MKKLIILLLFIPLVSLGQEYSNYYGAYDYSVKADVNVNANINKNVNVSGNINKTVTTIDYGALRLANAQQEKNRLESLMYSEEKQKKQAIEIAMNPLKAFDYGRDNNWVMDKKNAESIGFSKGTVYYHKVPNEALFVPTQGYNYRNESEDGIVTELELNSIRYIAGMTAFLELKKEEKKKIFNNWQPFFGNTEKLVKEQAKVSKVGELNENGQFTHKVDINKAKVFGEEGFVYSWFYEDDYEYVIKDNYRLATANGIIVEVGVRFRGDKDKIDFEMLEGRRNYLQRLCKQIIATANVTLGKKGLNK